MPLIPGPGPAAACHGAQACQVTGKFFRVTSCSRPRVTGVRTGSLNVAQFKSTDPD